MFVFLRRLFLLFLLFLIIFVWGYYDTNYPILSKVSIITDKYIGNQNIKILHITDYHNATYSTIYKNFFEKLKEEKIDMIVLTGDMLSRDEEDYTQTISLIKDLKAISSVIFYVSGNHEWDNKNRYSFWKDLENEGVILLNNKSVKFKQLINICGVDDFNTNHYDLEKALYGINPNYFTVLLSHSPKVAVNAQSLSADLVLSGHIHGGQFIIPFVGGIFSPDEEYFPKYYKGLYRLENGSILYLNSGLSAGTNLFRLNNRIEASLIEIRN